MRTCRRRLRLPSRLYPSRVATKGISAKAAPNTLDSINIPKLPSVSYPHSVMRSALVRTCVTSCCS